MTTLASRGRPAIRRVSLRTAFVALALVVTAGALAAFLWLRSYTALEFAGGATGPDIKSPLFYRSVQPPFSDGSSYILSFRPHSSFRFGVDVHNGGRFPVRIEGIVETDDSWQGPFKIAGIQMQHKPNWHIFKGATSEPLTIEPGDFGYVIPVLRTGARCNMVAGGESILSAIWLEYSYLGAFHRTQELVLPMRIGMVCNKPQQVVDRMLGP